MNFNPRSLPKISCFTNFSSNNQIFDNWLWSVFYISCRQVQFMRVIIPVLCQTTSKLRSEYTLLKVHFSYKRDRNEIFKCWLKSQVQTQTSNHMCLPATANFVLLTTNIRYFLSTERWSLNTLSNLPSEPKFLKMKQI